MTSTHAICMHAKYKSIFQFNFYDLVLIRGSIEMG